ncbi:hypothetical protein EVAR_66744_1 [Eumeta japonica]|uniref:Uncharacterized protein n=1 Tax=Eumeta variegata TaxID=151549 RepID=A0A4C1Z7T2_EUMVA|nr:hypothetical protein EVAR_66744_1 [Eumeta japonica]
MVSPLPFLLVSLMRKISSHLYFISSQTSLILSSIPPPHILRVPKRTSLVYVSSLREIRHDEWRTSSLQLSLESLFPRYGNSSPLRYDKITRDKPEERFPGSTLSG